MPQPWPWVKVRERSSNTFPQTHIFFVPNIKGLGQTVLIWEGKVFAAADADAAETDWKHKVTPERGDLMKDFRTWGQTIDLARYGNSVWANKILGCAKCLFLMKFRMKMKKIRVILGCANSSIAPAKHGCTGGWLILWAKQPQHAVVCPRSPISSFATASVCETTSSHWLLPMLNGRRWGKIFCIKMYWTQAKMLLLADVDEYSFAKAEHQNFTPLQLPGFQFQLPGQSKVGFGVTVKPLV